MIWNNEINNIYNDKNGLSRDLYKKIKTMRIGKTKKCCSVCF